MFKFTRIVRPPLGLGPLAVLRQLAGAPLTAGQNQFAIPRPNDPQFLGLSLAFQALHVAPFIPGTPLELSNGLGATSVP